MRVGLVCPYDLSKPGGVQQLTVELADQLRDAGDEVTLVAVGRLGYEGGPGLDNSTIPVGRPFYVRGNQSRVPLTLSPFSVGRVREALKSVDVVHVHEPLMPLAGWAALSVDKPMVATFHADAPEWARRLFSMLPLGSRMRRTLLTAVSDTARKAIPDSWGEVHLVPNALDVDSYRLDVGRVPRRVAFLGRDEPRKGLDVLLEAWPRVLERVPDAELVAMGPSRGTAHQNVRFQGPVTDGEKRRQLASSTVYVAPNLGGESFGIVIVEGMAAGCAVVASDLEAFRAVLGDSGVTFPVGDADALANTVADVLESPQRSAEMSAAGMERAQLFDWEQVTRQYRDLYTRAVS